MNKTRHYWTPEEIDFIKNNHSIMNKYEIAHSLNRSADKISRKASSLGIKIKHKDRVIKKRGWKRYNFQAVVSIGMVFGQLTVEAEGPASKLGHKNWYCSCNCGNPDLRLIAQSSLRGGDTTSCGCYQKKITAERKRKKPGHSSFHVLFCSYRGRAKRIGIAFSISFDEFKELSSGDCCYCGEKPTFFNKYLKSNRQKKTSQGFQASEEGIDRASIYVNGIDRVDNNLGYTKENCVPCCSFCNTMKMDRTLEDFLNHINKISNFQSRK